MKENYEIHWKDYYAILQVQPLAEAEVIRAAYQKLAMKYHPDHSNGTTGQKMKDLNEAFEILGNPLNRTQYDVFSSKWHQYFQPKPKPQNSPPPQAPPSVSRRQRHYKKGENEYSHKAKQDKEAERQMKRGDRQQAKEKKEREHTRRREETDSHPNDPFTITFYILLIIILLFGIFAPWYAYSTTSTLKTLWRIVSIFLTTICFPSVIIVSLAFVDQLTRWKSLSANNQATKKKKSAK